MSVFSKRAVDIFSPVQANGTPRSVSNLDAQVWGTELERLVDTVLRAGGKVYASKAQMDADLTPAANTSAIVIGDPVMGNNGLYMKIGGSGSGSWQRIGDVPGYQIIRLVNDGSGTPNAIVASSALPVPVANGEAILLLNITDDITGPATLSLNGGSAWEIVTSGGNLLSAGYLVSGMLVALIVDEQRYRLLSDVPSAAIQQAAEDAAARAEAAAASVNLPPATAGDRGKALVVNSDASGYVFERTTVVVDTRALLKDLPVSNTVAFLKELGREGNFVLKAGSPPVTDTQEGVYVISNTAGYYWERIYAPAVAPTVRAFGAVLDGAANDSNAIKGALAVCRIAVVPFTESGFVAGDIGLSPNRGETIMAPIRTIWKLPASAQCAVLLGWNEVAEQYAYLENFIFDGSAAPNTSGAIRVNTSAYVVSGFRAKRLIFKDCGFAYLEETSASNFTVDFEFVDCEAFYTRGRQVYSHRSRGFFRFRDFRINNVYNPYAGRPEVTWNSAYFGDVLGLELFGFDVVGPAPGAPNNPAYQSGAVGLYIDGITAGRGSIYGSRILVDSTNGPGIILANLFNIQWDQIQVYGCLGAGIGMTNVSKSTFSKVKCYGAKGTTNAPASAAGITMQNCSSVTLDVAEVENFTGSGVVMVASTECQVNGGYSNNNTGYGYYDDSAGDRNRRVGITARGNTGGSLFQDKASHATYSWTPNSGTPTASTIGVATVA
ncbi:right-handed parallel beta-helix repeat-containing protein [Brucella intermedia]|uniref:right-handed parallel beta-helix repeat-containing protein n=1 Tax=Brucella intermedia TaxID=94625 RepID=UPI0034CE0EE7